MNIVKIPILTHGIDYSAFLNGVDVGRGRLFFISNDFHLEPYAYVEDVFVSEQQRGQGIGTKLMEQLIHDAQALGCYKVIACSRLERKDVHEFYDKLGLKRHGYEFRLDF